MAMKNFLPDYHFKEAKKKVFSTILQVSVAGKDYA